MLNLPRQPRGPVDATAPSRLRLGRIGASARRSAAWGGPFPTRAWASLDPVQHPADYAALRDFMLANAGRLVYPPRVFRLQRSMPACVDERQS